MYIDNHFSPKVKTLGWNFMRNNSYEGFMIHISYLYALNRINTKYSVWRIKSIANNIKKWLKYIVNYIKPDKRCVNVYLKVYKRPPNVYLTVYEYFHKALITLWFGSIFHVKSVIATGWTFHPHEPVYQISNSFVFFSYLRHQVYI